MIRMALKKYDNEAAATDIEQSIFAETCKRHPHEAARFSMSMVFKSCYDAILYDSRLAIDDPEIYDDLCQTCSLSRLGHLSIVDLKPSQFGPVETQSDEAEIDNRYSKLYKCFKCNVPMIATVFHVRRSDEEQPIKIHCERCGDTKFV